MKLLASFALSALALDCSQVPDRIDQFERCIAHNQQMITKIDAVFKARICPLNNLYNGYKHTCSLFRRVRQRKIEQQNYCKAELRVIRFRRDECERKTSSRINLLTNYHTE